VSAPDALTLSGTDGFAGLCCGQTACSLDNFFL
jgi:hypothetical protein